MISCYSSDYVWVHLHVRLHSSFKARSGWIPPDVKLEQDVKSLITQSNTHRCEIWQSQGSIFFHHLGKKGFSAESNVQKSGCGFFFSFFLVLCPGFLSWILCVLDSMCITKSISSVVSVIAQVCSYQKTDLEIGNKNETLFWKKKKHCVSLF